MVGVAADKIKGLSTDEKLAMLSYADAPTRIAIMKDLTKSGDLHKIPNASKYIAQKYKDEFNRFGEGSAFGNVEKGMGFNIAMMSATDSEKRNKTAIEFYQTLDKEDRKKIKYDKIFGKKPAYGLDEESHDRIQRSAMYGMLMNDPGYTRRILTNTTPKNFEHAKETIKRVTGRDIFEADRERAEDINKSLDRTIADRRMGLSDEVVSTEEKKEEELKEKPEEKKGEEKPK